MIYIGKEIKSDYGDDILSPRLIARSYTFNDTKSETTDAADAKRHHYYM